MQVLCHQAWQASLPIHGYLRLHADACFGALPRRTAKNSVRFLREHMLRAFPFPIQHIQTDRGGEFFGMDFQLALMEEKIKFTGHNLGTI